MMEHEAGRELDYKIAALMGDRLIKRGKWKDYWDCGRGRHYSDEDGGPLHYSTDIAAAWRVVEHHPHFVSLTRSIDVSRFGFADHMTWKCRFYAPQSFEVEADDAPLAICRAALAARGEGEG